MAHINSITFEHAPTKGSGCVCDRCGQWITNIFTVSYTDGAVMHFGIDCFEKLNKESGLNAYSMKAMKKALERLQYWTEYKRQYESGEINEENDKSWAAQQAEWNKDSYWHGRDYEEYRDWIIYEFIPARFEDIQKELDKFSKIHFKRS